jgi:spore coat protein H
MILSGWHMGKRHSFVNLLVAIFMGFALMVAGCTFSADHMTVSSQYDQSLTETIRSATDDEKVTRPSGWTSETHSNNVEPNYEVVFPQKRVNQIKITIAPENWTAMQVNMTEIFGKPGVKQNPAGGGVQGAVPLPGGTVNPVWVPVTIDFEGETWTNVGFRYKGNSSLRSGWNSGTLILPFKLDFDEYEDEHPEINDQRFYGFKKLSFSNAFHDGTYMHDSIASYLMEEAGLAVAKTAYYQVVLDCGEGPTDLGLFVMIEVIDDTVISRFFNDDSGNIYKANGAGVTLAAGITFVQIQNSFQKENNTIDSDWSDIEALYNVLHSTDRISNSFVWRANLESIFDVDVFLKWLAMSAIIQNWDNYGVMTHNFYLYHNTETGLLTWISWDHNEILDVSGGGTKFGIKSNVSLDKKDIGQKWPLIRYLLDDPVYYDRYIDFIGSVIEEVFIPDKLKEKCLETAELIEPYITGNGGDKAFDMAVRQLLDNINLRFQTVNNFLSLQLR